MSSSCMSTMKPLPSLELLNHLFSVSDESPSGLCWKNPRSLKLKPNSIAGCLTKDGYWNVGIQTNKKTLLYRVHRIIFYIVHKKNINDIYVDHIDNNRKNNTIKNLRVATAMQNNRNQRKRQGKTSSKYKGVQWDKKANKWKAVIMVNYKLIYLGVFTEEKEAACAYNKAAQKHYDSFALLNNV